MGPLEVLTWRSKGSRGINEDADDLARPLADSRISSTPSKPLPDLPPPITPSQFYHQRLPQFTSLQHITPEPRSRISSQHASSSQETLQQPSTVQQHQVIYKERPLSIPHFRLNKSPFSWELPASAPSAAFKPALLSPQRPISAPPVAPITPKTPKRHRGQDVISDPKLLPGLHQCWGITREGNRCRKKVGVSASSSPSKSRARTPSKSPSPSKPQKDHSGAYSKAIVISDSEDDYSEGYASQDDEIREYCHQHVKEINKADGFMLPNAKGEAAGDGAYVSFETYLGELKGTGDDHCKAKLRTAMTQPPSKTDWSHDSKGFIYIYELRDRSTLTHIALKVGRAINVFKRIEEWRGQCQSKSPFLRGYFPQAEGESFQNVLPGASASVASRDGVLLSHKWEKLIHIELSHLGKRLDDKCSDCKRRHKEIFLMPKEIGYEGTKKVVEKWLCFVSLWAATSPNV